MCWPGAATLHRTIHINTRRGFRAGLPAAQESRVSAAEKRARNNSIPLMNRNTYTKILGSIALALIIATAGCAGSSASYNPGADINVTTYTSDQFHEWGGEIQNAGVNVNNNSVEPYVVINSTEAECLNTDVEFVAYNANNTVIERADMPNDIPYDNAEETTYHVQEPPGSIDRIDINVRTAVGMMNSCNL